jgi:hypothetical protein
MNPFKENDSKTKSDTWKILLIFFFILALRLVLSFYNSNLTYESYFHLRQVEHIVQTGLPLYEDPLSYGGREQFFLPLFHYLAALFGLFLPLEIVGLLLPNLLFASLTIIIYYLCRKITANTQASLLAALIAGLLPALYQTNSFTPFSLFLPLLFLAISSFLDLPNKPIKGYLIFFILLCFTSSATILLLFGFLIYLFLSYVERKPPTNSEKEIIFFSFLFYIWSELLFFKNTLLEEGIGFIWKNIPPQIIQEYFPSFSLSQSLLLVSVIPFLAGVYVIYRSLFELKTNNTFFIISLVLPAVLLTWLQLFEFTDTFIFLGLLLAILFSQFYDDLLSYISVTRAERWSKTLFPFFLILLLLTMIPSSLSASLNQDLPSDQEIAAFAWLRDNTPEDLAVLSTLEEGHLVTYFSQRKNVMDSEFSKIHDVEERFKGLNSLYTTSFHTEAIRLAERYDLKYFVITPHAQERYNLLDFKYRNSECFKKIYKGDAKIYQLVCTLEKSGPKT